MHFRTWLESIDYASGWLDPGGRFHSTSPYKSHADWAYGNGTDVPSLFQQGWLRVTFVGNELWASNGAGKGINSRQKVALIDYAISSGRFESVHFDNDEQDFLLWSR